MLRNKRVLFIPGERRPRLGRALVFFAMTLLAGCVATSSGLRPDSYYNVSSSAGVETLFAGDSAVLSNDEIARILNFRYAAPALSRVALLPSGWTTFGSWSEEMTLATDAIEQRALATLKGSSRIYDAAFLPSILVPKDRSVPYLREAAARFQADLLLVYKTACRSFERYRLFASDSTRAYCSVEAVLLDVRTGLVPYTISSVRHFDARKSDADINFQEAVLKAQLQAVSGALGEIAAGVVNFLAVQPQNVSQHSDGAGQAADSKAESGD
ncbi:MAG: hypothetical protein AAF529_17140 [Pseudomonadota bacterium]